MRCESVIVQCDIEEEEDEIGQGLVNEARRL
jgi:hypothetical protein